VLVAGSPWVLLVAVVAGALVGTAIGIVSAVWAMSSVRSNDEVAARLVADELRRLAGFLERCLIADVAPGRFLDAARTSELTPPPRAWAEHAPDLARCLEDQTWNVVTLAMSEWPVLFDALSQQADAVDWPVQQRQAIAALHREVLDAAEAMYSA
jgi:hypothetical protein